MDIAEPELLSNLLLAALPRKDFRLLVRHLSMTEFPQGAVLYESGTDVDQVYFPVSGMISLVVVLRDGSAVETATVGREGVIGAMAGLDVRTTRVRAVAQLPALLARISSVALRKAVGRSKPIARLCLRYNEVLLAQARITAACNASHNMDARFCRWLLQTRDRVDSNHLPLTQEFLGEMLGVARTSVTQVAKKVQTAGAISYSRGHIRIIDLRALKAMSCGCYETLRKETALG